MSSSRPDVVIRTPTEADAAAIAAVCNAIARDLYGSADAGEAEVRSWFRLADLEMLLAERAGSVVGYADMGCEADGTRFPIDLRVAPEARDPAVGAALLEAAEEAARVRAKPGALARAYAAERDRYAAGVLERAGYGPIRHSFQMAAELRESVDEPRWPPGIAVRGYVPERDEEGVHACVQEAFADHWEFELLPLDRWRERMMRDRATFDPSLWWLAEDDGRLAGVCLGDWHFSGEPGYGWIATLAVRRPWRRRGLALALLVNSFADFARRGAARVGLGVDGENTTGAVRLYERAGMRPVRRTDTYEKRL